MKVRRPEFDFSDTPPHWCAVPEFAQGMNAASLWIPYLERFLNRVLAKALKTLDPENPETERIKADGRMFIRQESNHYTTHEAFNTILARNGYDLAELEQLFEREFERLFSTKSLAFLTAYCEGFETLGPPHALVWLDEIEDLLQGARPEVVGLWKWHLMEEYEHRTVCHDVFHAIHGGYFMRLYGFFFQLWHLRGFTQKVAKVLQTKDEAIMSHEEIALSRQRRKQVNKQIGRLILPLLLQVLSPFYNPRRSPEPKAYRRHMAAVEAKLA
jgi:predicted metal-dependent hydrolase